jgi:hypothetical protein
MNNLSQYSDEELMKLAGVGGGDSQSPFGKDAPTFEKIKMAESSGNPKAINRNKNGTYDSGLYQINSIHIPELQKQGIIQNPNDLFDPNVNTKAASFLYKRDGLSPWQASKNKWDNGLENITDDELMRIAGISSDGNNAKEQPKKTQPEVSPKPTMFSKMGDALSQRGQNIRNIEQYAKEGTDWERIKRSPGYAIRT